VQQALDQRVMEEGVSSTLGHDQPNRLALTVRDGGFGQHVSNSGGKRVNARTASRTPGEPRTRAPRLTKVYV
jgi:hypothetical protein